MSSYLFDFKEIDKTKTRFVGAKGANLGGLSQIEGIPVPDGFCISTEVFKRIIDERLSIKELLDQLSLLEVEDRKKISELSAEIRRIIKGVAIPKDISKEITLFLSRFEEKNAYAVRSSATAEDLPTASFAGQQDTYLNIQGLDGVLRAVKQVFASLFNDRAIAYRVHQGFEHRKVLLSAGVQRMVRSDLAASGVIF